MTRPRISLQVAPDNLIKKMDDMNKLSPNMKLKKVTHPGAGGADDLQQKDMYCFAFDEILFTLNTRIIATFNGYPRSYLS